MIRLGENKSTDKKDQKRFFLVIYTFVLLSGIYTGMYCMRFGIVLDAKNHVEAAAYDFPLYFKYLTSGDDNNFDDVRIDFKFNQYMKLSNQRSRFVYSKDHFIDGKMWLERENLYAKADLKYNGQRYKIKAKLFGKNNDHYRHPYKWSFRVKAKEYIKDFDNGKFNLLQPHTRMYITDVLCNKVLEENGILSLKYKPINLKINDQPEDLYFVEDFFSKYLIERNGYRDSYIFSFNEIKHPSLDDLTEVQLNDLVNIQDDIRSHPNDILDIKKFDIFLALAFIAQNKHPYLKDNFHMFYNSVTNKVEPIIREVWFQDQLNVNTSEDLKNQAKAFIQLVKRNNRHLKTYLEAILNDEERLNQVISDMNVVAKQLDKILKSNEWKSFQDGIFTRYPEAIHSCKYIVPNTQAILGLNGIELKNELPTNEMKVLSGDVKLQEDVILEYSSLKLMPGTRLDLNGFDIILEYGHMLAISEVENPIQITNSSNTKASIAILNASSVSKFLNVVISNLSSLDRSYWHLPAAITFYESNVDMQNVIFESNRTGDDFVNFFRCGNFSLNNVKFLNVNADAVDSDFSKGQITNCEFLTVGNDAIDGSGSIIVIEDSSFDSVEDKVISAGEHSNMTISGSKISNSEIAFVSKDDSTITEFENTLSNNTIEYCLFSKKKEFDFGTLHSDKDISMSKYLIEKGSKVFKGREELSNLKVVDSVKESLYGKLYGKKS